MKSHALSRMLSKKMVFVLLCWAVDCTKQAFVTSAKQNTKIAICWVKSSSSPRIPNQGVEKPVR